MTNSVPLRVGLIGRGMAGTVFHAPLLRAAGFDLAAIAGSADAPALIADPSIELIVIATPNESHFPLARAALQAGKHVVIDKPMTLASTDADRLIEMASAANRMLSIFHNRRWDGDFLTVRDLVETGRLGDILLYQVHWDRFRPAIKPGWRETARTGAGLLWDLGPHLIDQALVLFGAPQRLCADMIRQRRDAAADDYFALTLDYGRLRVTLSASTMVAAARPRFDIHGTAGSFRKYGLDPQEAALRDGASPADPGFGDDRTHGTLTDAHGDGAVIQTIPGRYLAFYEGVAAAIRDGAPPPVDPTQARAVIRAIELAGESADAGRWIDFD